MAKQPNRTFGQVVTPGLAGLTAEHIEAAQKEARRTGVPALECIGRLGFADCVALLREIASALGTQYRALETVVAEDDAVRLLTAKQAIKYGMMPLEVSKRALVIATCDPFDFAALDEIRALTRRDVAVVISSHDDIVKAIKRHYGIGADAMEPLSNGSAREVGIRSDLAEEAAASDASVLKFVNLLLIEALRDRATDIHMEPFENDVRVRYRIDGILHETAVPLAIKNFFAAIVSRIKIMASLDISEHRLPQDGRMRISLGGEDFDLRVSILPSSFGESVNIRILNRSSVFLSLEELGLDGEDLATLERLILRPHGIILVTGPTGSGKTTTLYACLQKINKPDIKIITIEDPIEYQMHGVLQMQVHPRIGFSFATALRSMLRHDPDVMLVGEIRDTETAEITIRTALTGHLVFSTLHTNDSAGAATRLFDMGVEPFLASSSILGVMAQRLLRQICPRCKEVRRPEPEALREMGVPEGEWPGLEVFGGRGCDNCRYTGYRGRIAICEILPVNEPVRRLMLERAPSGVIKQKAMEFGMRTMRQDGLAKVKRGVTTIEEVLRITAGDEASEV